MPPVRKEVISMTVGAMTMPSSFKYRDVYMRGRPRHRKNDDFRRRHPPMSAARWAKIFSPFDALDGFDEAIAGKDVLYCERRVLAEDETADLDRVLALLHSLTCSRRAARANAPAARITYFVPCSDIHSAWFGHGGQYRTVTGTIREVDAAVTRTLTLDDRVIPLEDISACSLTVDEPMESPTP